MLDEGLSVAQVVSQALGVEGLGVAVDAHQAHICALSCLQTGVHFA